MSLGAGIFDFLSSGLSVGERVYPLTLPQRVQLPAITYQVISDLTTVSHATMQDNPAWTGALHTFTRVQFGCYGRDYDEAEALCDELRAYAVGYRGTWGDIEVDSVRPDLRLDDWDEEPGLYRVIQDMVIGHRSLPGS